MSDANGIKFLFKCGSFVLSDEALAEIENGVYRDRGDFLETMKDATWNELKRQLRVNNVAMSMLFQCTGEIDQDGMEVVEPEAIVLFIEMLYPNLMPGHHILVCLPPVKGDQLVMDTAFNVCLSYSGIPDKIAIMGAQHNDMSTDGSVHEVEENFYIYSNRELQCTMFDAENMNSVSVPLCSAISFMDAAKKDAGLGENTDLRVGRLFTSLTDSYSLGRFDWNEWHTACIMFQNSCRDKLFEALECDGVACGLGPLDKDTLYANNIIGLEIPKNTTFMTVKQGPSEHPLDRIKRKQAELDTTAHKRERVQSIV